MGHFKGHRGTELIGLSFGNFVWSIPFAIWTKMAAEGLFASQGGRGLTAFEIFPLSAAAGAAALLFFFSIAGWYRHSADENPSRLSATSVRWPPLVWGICNIAQIVTVTWLYAFNGISIVYAALLMKGGALMLAPAIDLLVTSRKRFIHRPSWIGALLSLAALIVASSDKIENALNPAGMSAVLLYLSILFVKLVLMSRYSKGDSAAEKRRFLVEGQVVTCVGYLLLVFTLASLGARFNEVTILGNSWRGLCLISDLKVAVIPMVIGLASTGVGLCSTLMLLDRRENTFCVTLVQSTSVIAGFIANIALAFLYDRPYPGMRTLIGVAIMLLAIAVLGRMASAVRREEAPSSGVSNIPCTKIPVILSSPAGASG